MHDLVIRGARLIDGTGRPASLADIAVTGGLIAALGDVRGRARRTIDAPGLTVIPGVIDPHSHADLILPLAPERQRELMRCKLAQGITTTVIGNCGLGCAPVANAAAEAALRAVNAWMTPEPVAWPWRGVGDYLDHLERNGLALNVATLVPHGPVRISAMGLAKGRPSPAQARRMRGLVGRGLREGALGLSSGLIYPPGMYSDPEELTDLARLVADYGGVYASHIRGEGAEVVQSVQELITIAEKAGLPGEVFHLKVAHRPSWGIRMDSVRQVIEAARARGVDVAADMYVYTAGGTGLEATIPSWAFEGGTDSLRARLNNPQTRARLKREQQTGSPGWWNIVEAAGGWNGVILVNARNPENAKYEQKPLSEIARLMNKEPADAAMDLVLQGQGRVMAIYHMMGEPDIETALRFPWTSIGSDAGAILTLGQPDQTGLPHPRSFGNAARVIAEYVKKRKVLSLEEAVRKMTSWPATRMRLANRGMIKEGHWADVTIFDLEKLDDRATYDQPMIFPTGIEYVLVNGVVTIDRDKHTGAKAGKVLYGPGKQGTGNREPGTGS